MDRPTALALLGAQCAASVYPTLDATALGVLLDATARWTTWLPATGYAHGDVVIPTVRNGHCYRAIVNQQYGASPAGVSGATEPLWPLYANPQSAVGVTRPYWSGWGGNLGAYAVAMIADGTIIWQEAGPDNGTQWDVRAATRAAWLQKAALASADYDTGIDKDKYTRSQVAQQCMAMARTYAPTGVV